MNDTDILAKLQSDLVEAMKAKDAETLSTLRMLKTALMEAKTRKPKDAEFTADEAIEVMQRYVRKRRDTIEELTKVGRTDLVPNEEREIAVTMRYLPQPLGEDEVRALVAEAVTQTGAASPKDMGKVMGVVMGRVKGRADGGLVSRLVKEALAPPRA